MKNDSFLTTRMDLPEENGSHGNDVYDEKMFNDSSGYTNDFGEEAKPNDNVNTQAMEWSLRHNSETERFPFTCNGFRWPKTPRYTCTGRISRVPSRYLDSDSDSDGSQRKTVVSRLKVKRRRKPSSSNNKVLVNGFKGHDDVFSLDVTNLHSDSIIFNSEDDQREGLADLECPEVFEEGSVPDDTISRLTHEPQTRTVFQGNSTLNETVRDLGSVLKVKLNGILKSDGDSASDFGLNKASVCCSEATGDCVDISIANKRQPRFDSSMVSTARCFGEIACDKQTCSEFNHEEASQSNPTAQILDSISNSFSNTCINLNAHLNNKESCDSSTKATFVSSMQISKQRKVSCASSEGNDHKTLLREETDSSCCLETVVPSSVNNGCLPSDVANGREPSSQHERSDSVKGDVILTVTPLKSGGKLPEKQIVDANNTNTSREEGSFSIKPEGLNCFRNFKMGRGYARKLNQKQKIRRTERKNGCLGLKKQGLIGKIKQKSVNQVKKAVKLQKTVEDHKDDVQKNVRLKSSNAFQELDTVLGMRRNPVGVYEFLVQWANGTSCWVSSDQIVTNKHNCILRQYLMENDQDVSVINRVPFQAYCCDSLSLKECKPIIEISRKKNKSVHKPRSSTSKSLKDKGDVSVENDGGHCYITLNRETCKRKLTCLKIVSELIAALEDASVSDCHLVVIRGLGSKVLGGLNLDNICKASAEEKGNLILLKIRYLVQTLSNYPKPLIALISKPAEGIGAVFLSLFDMICDEETWKKEQVIANSEEIYRSTGLYCLPRVVGHSIPCEEILMGKKCGSVQTSESTVTPSVPEMVLDDCSDNSTVVNTLKDIEATIHRLGKKTTSLMDMNGEEILKMTMNEITNFGSIPGSVASCDSTLKPDNSESNTSLNAISTEQSFNDDSFPHFTGSSPADRYVKELESKILEEKQLVQQYIEEISSIWKSPSIVLSNEKY